ncbi:kinase-like protein [Trematosphaeria pertusa]|uniref:EKC/KEOPS complex subunit BUD32 n=1 Tax=Trematosphaeria pertusa TaxID=390896 RepID=A0A6A6HTL6_9PLEO|nr:kinase-like protein [Trematosphaeria pertusa]KAF2241361.1 kinase-like protein [Trematosphaeria pertusa]
MAAPEYRGSTSLIFPVRPGVIVKRPAEVWKESSAYTRLTQKIANNFLVERKILEALGAHPRIVKYHGWQDKPESLRGLLLSKASHGNLQRYLEANHDIPLSIRQRWCRQAVESIAYIHHHGVIHSDLRPNNFLVHATTPTSLDLWLCDFGGSTCEKLGVDGKQLPDPGFFDPNAEWVSTTATDIFSVGSVLYSIVSGHWPHRDLGPFKLEEDYRSYNERVEEHFRNREYPDVDGLFGGTIILGCWTNEYSSADDVLRALDQEIKTQECGS